MKKILCCLALVLCITGMTAWAASGDICGNIYPTDIVSYINGVEVPSYNIGGKTVVIVEDITTQYRYYDSLRTLVIDDLSPEKLVGGKNINKSGNIYETDIKTYYRGKELTAYSLDGRMAVVVEQLGDDNTFSEIGGKYIWNGEKRTLTLETLYRYPYSMRTMLEDKNYNITLTDGYGYLEAIPVAAPLNAGYILYGNEMAENSILPIKYNGEIVGYKCSFADLWVEDNVAKEVQSPVEFFYVDKVEEMIFKSGDITPTAEDWLNYFNNHTLSTIKQQYETDEYLFLYMFSSYVMQGSDRLVKINKDDGTKIEYQNMINSESYMRFESVVIDEEAQKVYADGYVIDLKADSVMPYLKLTTDIGDGMADESPSEYNVTCGKNSQFKYKLISGNEEITVDGFSIPDYYYANMLPLKETFDFLGIKYTFENNILTIDTTNAREFNFEVTENKADVMGDAPVSYLYIEKVILDGAETQVTYSYISGHFENTSEGRAEAKPYVVNGKVYINDSFIRML